MPSCSFPLLLCTFPEPAALQPSRAPFPRVGAVTAAITALLASNEAQQNQPPVRTGSFTPSCVTQHDGDWCFENLIPCEQIKVHASVLHEALLHAPEEVYAILTWADLHVDEHDTTQVTAALILL